MDLLTLAAACAIGARSALFFPLGTGDGCPGAVPRGVAAAPAEDARVAGPWAAYVAEASRRFGVPERWIQAVMRAESGGLASAISPAGAMGLMQVMPATYAGLRARYGLGANPYDARDSILAGAAYLREMHDRYGSPGFLAAYNAGPERLEEHLATGRPLPAETQRYVAAVAPGIVAGAPDQPAEGPPAVRIGTQAAGAVPAQSGDALFAVRTAAAHGTGGSADGGSNRQARATTPSGNEAGMAPPPPSSRPDAAAPRAPELPILRAMRQQDTDRADRRPDARSGALFVSMRGTPDAGTVPPDRRSGNAGQTADARDAGLFAITNTAWTVR